MQAKVLGTDLFLNCHVQNIPGYKATLPVLAFGCTIHSNATSIHKHQEFSLVRVIICVIIDLNE